VWWGRHEDRDRRTTEAEVPSHDPTARQLRRRSLRLERCIRRGSRPAARLHPGGSAVYGINSPFILKAQQVMTDEMMCINDNGLVACKPDKQTYEGTLP
jgi:hypothetical protein